MSPHAPMTPGTRLELRQAAFSRREHAIKIENQRLAEQRIQLSNDRRELENEREQLSADKEKVAVLLAELRRRLQMTRPQDDMARMMRAQPRPAKEIPES